MNKVSPGFLFRRGYYIMAIQAGFITVLSLGSVTLLVIIGMWMFVYRLTRPRAEAKKAYQEQYIQREDYDQRHITIIK